MEISICRKKPELKTNHDYVWLTNVQACKLEGKWMRILPKKTVSVEKIDEFVKTLNKLNDQEVDGRNIAWKLETRPDSIDQATAFSINLDILEIGYIGEENKKK